MLFPSPPPATHLLLPVLIVYDPLCGRCPVKIEKGVKSDERGQEVPAGEWNAVAYLGPKCHRNYQKNEQQGKNSPDMQIDFNNKRCA